MATLTIRNLPLKAVVSLKSLAERNGRSMEQEVREMVVRQVGDRLSAINQIKAAWKNQKRPATTGEIDAWIRRGRG